MQSSSKLGRVWEGICEVLWALALICLPLTSFPLLSSLSGGLVAPLAILPIAILLIIWTIPLIFRKGELPKETLPLVVFFLVVVISSAAAYFIDVPGFKGKTVPAQEIRALFTLLVGMTFYFVTTSWLKTNHRLLSTWKYITIGGILVIFWTSLQAYYISRHLDFYPAWMTQIQSWLVVLSPQYSPKFGRVNGFTYEASWFAHQMVIVYLPIWFAATFYKTSAFKFRVFRISIENILLVLGLGLFFLSSPRIGLISFLIMIIFLFIKVNVSVYRRILAYLAEKFHLGSNGASRAPNPLIKFFTGFIIIVAYILVLLGGLYFLTQRDWRLSALVSQPPTKQELAGLLSLDQQTLLTLSQRAIFLERMVYWLNGWNIFNQYPWLGVGLGNAGFFFPKLAPATGWASTEIRDVLFYMHQLPNVKSFWFRLLAETGIVGFAVFITWIYTLFQSARYSHHSSNKMMKTLALAGQLCLLAFIGEGFSVDSFALPYIWVMAGLIASMALIFRRETSENQLQSESIKRPDEG